MEILVASRHIIVFKVEFFQPDEGGMTNEQYGEDVSTVEEAVALLEVAKRADPSSDWIITGHVKTSVTGETLTRPTSPPPPRKR